MLRLTEDRITNDEVYRRMGTVKAPMEDIVRRQLSFLGHVLRKDELKRLVVTDFVDGNVPEADNERPLSLSKVR